MIKFEREAIVPYSASDMYKLVNDVAAYPQFLPWCSAAEVSDQTENEMTASLSVAAAGVHKSFTTRNELVPGKEIKMQHVDGPFKSLLGIWRFQDLETGGSRVELELEFEVEGGLKSALFGLLFNKATEKLVQAFSDRAQAIYGGRS